jgi:hypothetical protein
MVGQDQYGACHRSPAKLANPHPDQRAEHPMVQMGDDPLQPQIEGEADHLKRQQHKGEGEQRQCD